MNRRNRIIRMNSMDSGRWVVISDTIISKARIKMEDSLKEAQ
jgi:hypothetical protein